jgi:acyl-CoA synthetase (AMP-forming)/AMP-acid ligase II
MLFRSKEADISIPDVGLTQMVLAPGAAPREKPALIDGATGRSLTYGQLAHDVRRVAAALHARGFRKGDVFAIFSPNVPEYAVAFHAVSLLGGVCTTINPSYTAGEVSHQLRDANAVFLLTVPALTDGALEAVQGTSVRELFVLGDAEGAEGAEGATPFAALLESENEPPPVEIDAAEDLVALPYSSGTTGLPKGVMLTHRNLVANLLQIETCRLILPDDVVLCVLPLYHIYGLSVIMNLGLYTGATIVVMPRFDLEDFLRIMQDYRVTLAPIVPPLILALSKHPLVEAYDLSSLRLIFSGAAPLSQALTSACAERTGCIVRQGYGMTETSPATHLSPNDPAEIKPGSVGPCVPGTECKIIDTESGVLLGAGREGEICVRGPQVMKGYLNRPEATRATIDAEGWLHTGDVGYVDEDGHLFIVDRVKELIKYKGLQVAPAELEALLLAHPSVADAAVIPSPDEEAGEVPKAFVVLRGEANAEELMAFVAGRVAPHKKIRKLEFIEQIPKSASGKILRRVLVERERLSRQE